MIAQRRPRTAPAAVALALLLFGDVAAAAGTSQPPTPALDPATAACVKKANAVYKACTLADCITPYKTAIGSCFALGKGATCGVSCASRKVRCDAATTSSLASCRQACASSADVTCGDVCTSGALFGAQACKTAFTACLVKCPVLGTVPTTTTTITTTTTPRSTVTSTTMPPATTSTSISVPSTTSMSATTSTTLRATTSSTVAHPTTTTRPRPTTTTRPRPTTTTTTLPPLPPFSDATQACLDQAAGARKSCTASSLLCEARFASAFANCFAPGTGVACAALCVNQDAVCEMPTTSKGTGCASACQNAWTVAGPRCHGDAACTSATTAAFATCSSACAHPTRFAQCRSAFAACLTSCANLPDPGTTTTTTLAPTTTTTLAPTTTTTTTPPPTRMTATTTSTIVRPTVTATTTVKPSTTSISLPRTTTSTAVRPTTTSTTRPSASPFSPATAACIKEAQLAFKMCSVTALPSSCRVDYDATYPQCFAPGEGVDCATACVSTRRTGENPVQNAEKACGGECVGARTAARKQCAPGDSPCFAAAQAGYSACKQGCAQQVAPALAQCKSAFDACISSCPNL